MPFGHALMAEVGAWKHAHAIRTAVVGGEQQASTKGEWHQDTTAGPCVDWRRDDACVAVLLCGESKTMLNRGVGIHEHHDTESWPSWPPNEKRQRKNRC
jgi:hypothetical protein